jgi:hypothetical protein
VGISVYPSQQNADRFRLEWEWVDSLANQLERVLLAGRWNDLPRVLAKLLPHFSDVKLTKMTRTSALWDGCYQRLLKERSSQAVATAPR